MSNAINVRIKNKTNPESTWNTTLSDYVLLSGELAFATTSDNFKFKVGNGVSAWHDLPSFSNIVNIAESAYIELVEQGNVDPDITYVVSSDYVNAYGQQIKNVMAGNSLSDAVNFGQLNQLSGSISQKINQSISVLSGSISALSGEVAQCITSADLIEPITWQNLVDKTNTGKLVPGKSYRIIDYVTTTNGNMASRSAGNQFDLIVTAISPSKLSEVAKADKHEGVTYFDYCNMSAWKIWYRLSNDTSEFDWAVTSANGGKGVIYRMVDELNNDVPYDFKNIQFRPYGLVIDVSSFNSLPISGDPTKYYYVTSTSSFYAWNPDWTSDEDKYIENLSGLWQYTFAYKATTIDVTTRYSYKMFVTNNQIKPYFCESVGYVNKYALNQIVMRLGNRYDNAQNAFGNNCYCITLDNDSSNNSFDNGCHHICLGQVNCYNTFGKNCRYIKFVNMPEVDIQADTNYTYKNYVKYMTVESGNSGILINMTGTTSISANYQNAIIKSGTHECSDDDVTYKTITDATSGGQTFNTTFKAANSWEVLV